MGDRFRFVKNAGRTPLPRLWDKALRWLERKDWDEGATLAVAKRDGVIHTNPVLARALAASAFPDCLPGTDYCRRTSAR